MQGNWAAEGSLPGELALAPAWSNPNLAAMPDFSGTVGLPALHPEGIERPGYHVTAGRVHFLRARAYPTENPAQIIRC